MYAPIEKKYFAQFCHIGKRRLIKKGECLYNSNTSSEYVYCIESGLCALLSITKSGEEKIYHYFSAGNLINFTPAYLSTPSNVAFFMYAKTDCYVYELTYNKFYALLTSNPDLNRYVMILFASHFSNVLSHFHFMQEASVPSRVCKTLLDFSTTLLDEHIVHKHFSYVEIGKYLGVHTVTISRIMGALKQEGAIEKRGHCIILKDIELLKDYMNELKSLSY